MKTVYFSFIALMLISSCASDKVMSDSWIQKRKYTKGFYIAKKTKTEKAEPIEKVKAIHENSSIENTPVLSASLGGATALGLQQTTLRKHARVEEVKTQSSKSDRVLRKIEKKIQKLESTPTKPNSENTPVSDSEISLLLLVIIAILLPPLAVGLVTDWDLTSVLIGIILWLLFYLPGLIYALFLILS